MATRIAIAFALCASAVTEAKAHRYVTLGPSDGFALGQPLVAIEVFRDSAATYSFGPREEYKYVILDTGANGILLDGNVYSSLVSRGYESVAVYDEQGVAGTSPLDVSDAYRLDFRGTSGPQITLHNAHMMASFDLDFGSTAGFYGLVGMPGMRDRITSLDMDGEWFATEGGGLGLGAFSPPVVFPDAVPAGSGHRYHIPLRLQDFPQNGQREPSDPLPTWAPIPFAPVHLENFGRHVQGEMLVDTGAQISVLSTATAIALGLDENGNGTIDDEAFDFLPIGGIGGTVLMPILQLEKLSVQTSEGIELGWTDVTIGVHDIDPSISGIFAMNFLTDGWADAIYGDLLCEILPEFCDPNLPDGYVERVHFDFRDAANLRGEMIFDLNPSLDVVRGAVDGDTDSDGDVDLDDLNNVRNHFGGIGNPVAGDTFPFDGDVDVDDLNAVRNQFGAAASAAVPEPASATLLIVVAACLFARFGGRQMNRQVPGCVNRL